MIISSITAVPIAEQQHFMTHDKMTDESGVINSCVN